MKALEDLARRIARTEAGRAGKRKEALQVAERLHGVASAAIAAFARAAADAGAPHLDLIEMGPVEPDDKSIRAFQFRVRRGRWEAIVVSKDRAEVMFVGPFKRGSAEEPCRPVHLEDAGPGMAAALEGLESLLAGLVEQACET